MRGIHIGAAGLFSHVPDFEAEDGKPVHGHAQGLGILAGAFLFPGGGEKGFEQRDQAGVHAFHAVVAFLIEAVNAPFAIGNDFGPHVPAAGHVFHMPEPEIAQMLGQGQGVQGDGAGQGVGGRVRGHVGKGLGVGVPIFGFGGVPGGGGLILKAGALVKQIKQGAGRRRR